MAASIAEVQALRAEGTREARQAALDQLLLLRDRLHHQEEQRQQLEVLQQIGAVSAELGDFETAAEAFSQALILAEEIGDTKTLGAILTGLAHSHQVLGQLRTALDDYQAARASSRPSGDASQEAAALMGMGFLYDHLGQRHESLSHLAAALEIFRREEDRRGEAYALTGLSSVYLSLGDYTTAGDVAREAVALLRAIGDTRVEATALGNLGLAETHTGELRQALATYEQALELARAAGDRLAEAPILNNLAVCFRELGDTGRARETLEEALALHRELGYKHGEAQVLWNLGSLGLRTDDVEKAEARFQEVLELSREAGFRELEADGLAGLARVARVRGDLQSARAQIEEALSLLDTARAEVAIADLRASSSASSHEHYAFYVDLLMALHGLDHSQGMDREAFQASERARGRGLLELIQASHSVRGAAEDPEVRRRRREHRDRFNRLQRSLLRAYTTTSEVGAGTTERLEQEIAEARAAWREIEFQGLRGEPSPATEAAPPPLAVEQVQELLDAETALLEYALGEERSFLFVITGRGFSAIELPPASWFDKPVEALHRAASRPGQTAHSTFLREARRLHQALIEPAEGPIGHRDTLILVPDGVLHDLPFAALLTSGTPAVWSRQPPGRWPYLIRRHALTYTASASLLPVLERRRARRPEAPRDLLAYGDPVYPDSGAASVRSSFGPSAPWRAGRLPFSRDEVERIADVFGRSRTRLFLGAAASESNVRRFSGLGEARYLHFAVHGLVNPQRPEYSGLILSLPSPADGATEGAEDGLLQVYEVLDLDLGAELVVLSACETGLGRRLTGEGVLGLSRAFLQAGADSLLVSLWKVSDRSTPELMEGFYRNLVQRDFGKARALQQAQRSMIDDPRFAHPYHWAAFTLSGQP